MKQNKEELVRYISHEIAVWIVSASVVSFILGFGAGVLMMSL